MPYVYRRQPDLIDLFIEVVYRKEVVIQDTLESTGDYVVVLNGTAFRASDSVAGSDDSAAIATSLAGDITASSLAISASASGNVLTLTSDVPGIDFSIQTSTTEPAGGGTLYYRDANPEEYEVKNAANWDGVFSVIETVPQIGKSTSSVGVDPVPNGQWQDKYVRYRFAPTDVSLEDDDVLFFKITPVFDGVPGTDGRILIVLTPEQLRESTPAIVLNGNAPVASDSDSALEFVLPFQTSSLEVKNLDGSNTVYLSFGTGDGEIPLASAGDTFRDNRLGSGDIRIRSEVAPVPIYIYVALNANRVP